MKLTFDPFSLDAHGCHCGGREELAPMAFPDKPPVKGFRCTVCGFESVPAQVSQVVLAKEPIPLWAQWGPYSVVNHNAVPPWLISTAGTVPV